LWIPYKTRPLTEPHPAYPQEKYEWEPVLKVRLSNPATHSPPTPFFEVVVDSGSHACYFRSDVGEAVGLKIGKGKKSRLYGVKKGLAISVYFHNVNLYVGSDMIRIPAGFTDELSAAGLLGRRGFFENFIVRFYSSASPAGFEIQRIYRA